MAVGDPRLVTVATVRRGADVYDLVLQPQMEAGATNMVVWFGPLTTAWHLEIGPGPRTADLVFIVTTRTGLPGFPTEGPREASSSASPPAPPAVPPPAGRPAGQSPGGPAQAAARPSAEQKPVVAPTPAGTGSPEAVAPGAAASGSIVPAGRAPTFLEIRQSVQAVEAVFQAQRAAEGVLIRYHLTNRTAADLVIRPAGVLVRVDGRPAPYGMARESVDRDRPDVLPRGATETGMIDAAGSGIRRVQLIVALTPLGDVRPSAGPAAATGPGNNGTAAARAAAPIVLQATFTGLDSLTVSPAP